MNTTDADLLFTLDGYAGKDEPLVFTFECARSHDGKRGYRRRYAAMTQAEACGMAEADGYSVLRAFSF